MEKIERQYNNKLKNKLIKNILSIKYNMIDLFS
jgi:hypothetical protein